MVKRGFGAREVRGFKSNAIGRSHILFEMMMHNLVCSHSSYRCLLQMCLMCFVFLGEEDRGKV